MEDALAIGAAESPQPTSVRCPCTPRRRVAGQSSLRNDHAAARYGEHGGGGPSKTRSGRVVAMVFSSIHRMLLRFERGVVLTLDGWNSAASARSAWESLRSALRRIADGLRAVIARLEDRESVVSPSPAALARGVVVKAMAEAVDWGRAYGREYPDVYEVGVSPEAWDRFYGRRARQIEERIAQLAGKELGARIGGAGVPLLVKLGCDELLRTGGYAISASFGDGRAPHRDVPGPEPAPAPSLAGAPATPVPGGLPVDGYDEGDSPERTPVAGAAGASPADATEPMQASPGERLLVRLSGESYLVDDGMTLGVARNGVAVAAISLPYSEDLRYVSAIHLAFHYRDGEGWSVEGLGRNGSTLIVGSREHELPGGQVVPIEGGSCRIRLPFSSRVLHVCAADENGAPRGDGSGTMRMPRPRPLGRCA